MKRKEAALTLAGHLTELRSRLIRSTSYVALGTTVGWIFYEFFFQLIGAPIMHFLGRAGTEFLVIGVTDAASG